MQVSWFLVCVPLLVSMFQLCRCDDLSAYNDCLKNYSCGSVSSSYPFWGEGRPSYCGVSDFQLHCKTSKTEINITGDRYRVWKIDGDRTLTIVRSDILNWAYEDASARCPQFRNDSAVEGSLLFPDYGPGTQYLTMFYGCDSEASVENGGSKCNRLDLGNFSRYYLYFSADSGSKNQTINCEGSILVPVRPYDKKAKLSYVPYDGFDIMMAPIYESDCAKCTKSGGVCGTTKNNDDSFHCYCKDGTSERIVCSSQGKKKTAVWRIPMVIVGSVLGSCIILGIIFCVSSRNKLSSADTVFFWKKSKKAKRIEEFLRNNESIAPKRYHYSDIQRMTGSFKDKLGQGAFGDVFKGKLLDGRLVAVKVMKELKGDGEDFINEVASISRTSHVNVVSLLGFCFDGSNRALIYEFMSNGSLEKFIYKDKPLETTSSLPWQKLYEIVVGVSRGLEYLHRGCNTRIVHFDIKPHNILLDEDFVPKISDFGLAKLCSTKESYVSMWDTRGTAGYIAPEVFCRSIGEVSHKSDVYSYGMMILEIVGGRKNINQLSGHTSEIFFPHWIHKRIELNDDLGLHGIASKTDAELTKKMILVGLWCIQTSPSDRPSMRKVVEMLEGSLESLRIPPMVVENKAQEKDIVLVISGCSSIQA